MISAPQKEEAVTDLLRAWRQGDRDAEGRVFEFLYGDLKRIAIHERIGEYACTMQATEIVHEAYLRMSGGAIPDVNDRRHFLALATGIMRRVLIDRARLKGAHKRTIKPQRLEMSEIEANDLILLNDGLTKLELLDSEAALIVSLRYFAGFTVEETAEAMGLGSATVVRRWRWARAWLQSSFMLSKP